VTASEVPQSISAAPVYGVDPDRTQTTDVVTVARRRFEGRYPVDPFGADPQLQDLIAPFVTAGLRVDVEHPERLPGSGPAVLVSNRGLGVIEPAALSVALRQESGRRLRVVGAPDVPFLGDLARKLGAVMSYANDLAALLRAGHVAALPLGPTWLRTGTGAPPITLLVAALGYPVIPVAVRPGGPLGLPIRPWKVTVGRSLPVRAVRGSGDPLAAAELAEAARESVLRLLDSPD
jgi:1-acyl-sn-glycerol-3-phosphate acyltransferase